MFWNREDNMIERAQKLATKVHNGQTRWGGEPFIVHPKGVVDKLRDRDIFERWTYHRSGSIDISSHTPCPIDDDRKHDYYIVGWLHDVVEDTPITLGNLLDLEFSYDIVQAVDALTRRDDEDYREYILRVRKNDIALEVKISDIEHNLESFNTAKNKSRADKYRLAIEVLKQRDAE